MRAAWRPWILGGPLAAACLFASDFTARRITGGHADVGLFTPVGSRDADATTSLRLFPSLRALLVQVWLVRIDADLRASRPWRALAHARQALAIAPDLSAARVQLSDVLARDLPPRELDAERRIAWIDEAVTILDEGLRRRPSDGLLHYARGLLIWERAEQYPDFGARFERAHGATPLEVGTDELVLAAELEPRAGYFLRDASILLHSRGLTRRDAGRLDDARKDFEREQRYLETLLAFSDFKPDGLLEDLAEARRELARR